MKTVELTTRAIKDLKGIKSFLKQNLVEQKVDEFIDSLFQRMLILESSDADLTNIGAIDEEFSHLKYAYRKLIEGHYKITYREGTKKIYVIRIFDTRRHPNKNR